MVTNTAPRPTTEWIDTGENSDRLGRRITRAARRAELVAAWEKSGMTQAGFARREGVNYTTFASWVQQARKPGRPETEPARAGSAAVRRPRSVDFVQGYLPAALAAAEALEVRLPDGTILRGGGPDELARLVRALKG